MAWEKCPHCNGKTKCNCATCGTETTTRARGAGAKWMDAGMCQACNGQGGRTVPDPPMQSSSNSNSGCCVVFVAGAIGISAMGFTLVKLLA
jgi:hypothetical protein